MQTKNLKTCLILLITAFVVMLSSFDTSLYAQEDNTVNLPMQCNTKTHEDAPMSYSPFKAVYDFYLDYHTTLHVHATVDARPGGQYYFVSIDKFTYSYNFGNPYPIPLSVGQSVNESMKYLDKIDLYADPSILVYVLSNLTYSLSSDRTLCTIKVTGTLTNKTGNAVVLPAPKRFTINLKAGPGLQ